MLKKIALLLAFTALSAGASAQTAGQPADKPGKQAPPFRITANIQIQIPWQFSDRSEDQKRALESARRTIYEMAAGDCRVIAEVFKASCRLVNVNVSSNILDRRSGSESISANGNAQYEVTSE